MNTTKRTLCDNIAHNLHDDVVEYDPHGVEVSRTTQPHLHQPHPVGQLIGAVVPGELMMRRVHVQFCILCRLVYFVELDSVIPPAQGVG